LDEGEGFELKREMDRDEQGGKEGRLWEAVQKYRVFF
jgi:hypothetical protein